MYNDLLTGALSIAALGIGLLMGYAFGGDNARRNLLESCGKHGIYIIEGAAIQCPTVIKTK